MNEPINKQLANLMLYVNIWRFLNIGVLTHLWWLGGHPTNTFILILLLLVMTSLRWRFRMPLWTVIIDVIICTLYNPFTQMSVYGFALPIFELAYRGRWQFALVALVILPSFFDSSVWIYWYLIQALFFGIFAHTTLVHHERYKHEADEHRKVRYELEQTNAELIETYEAASHQAELMERHRISRELHDHLGHDLTGASLALRAYDYVQDPEEAKQLLGDVKQRVERSVKHLRETVHNMTPFTLIGVDRLEEIVQQCQYADIKLHKSGNMQSVSAHHWVLLEACLKEALTNVAKHTNATLVEVELQVTTSIIRLSVQDNGSLKNQQLSGTGLRSLQMRSRSMGGSLSYSYSDTGFLLVCVIPLELGGDRDEAANRR